MNLSTLISPSVRLTSRRLASNPIFEMIITVIIVINSVLIGLETYFADSWIIFFENLILYIFTLEVCLRFLASESVKAFFSDGWNIFDVILVIAGYIPESMVHHTSSLLALRILRILRILRLLKVSSEMRMIIQVLVKSTKAVFYNILIFFIFIYLFAIIGVGLFRLPSPEDLSGEKKECYEAIIGRMQHTTIKTPDPFGNLSEAMFTLFRELSGDDWTALRYDHVAAYEMGLIKTPPAITNAYHILWFIISACLLLNLLTGAIVNNYHTVMEKSGNQSASNV